MQNSRLFQVLATFSPREMHLFGQFLNSPYHNGNQRVICLFGLIQEYYFTDKEQLTRENAFAQLYPDKPYHRNSLNTVLSDLLRLAEEFLMQEFLRKEPEQHDHLLRKELLNRGLLKRFEYHYKHQESRAEKVKRKGFDFFERQSLALQDFYRYEGLKWGAKVKKYPLSLQEMMDAFDVNYLMTRLLYSYEMVNVSFISKEDAYDMEQLTYIQALAEYLSEKIELPILKIFLSAIHSIRSTSSTDLENLVQLIENQAYEIPRADLSQLFTVAINISIRSGVSVGNDVNKSLYFKRITLRLYQLMNEQAILFPKGNISLTRLKNAVAVSLQTGNTAWASALLEEYSPPQIPEWAYCLNMANIRYHQKLYADANVLVMNLLQSEGVLDSYLRDARYLQIKILFDEAGTEFSQHLTDTIHAFKAYIRTNKAVSATNKRAYHNFCVALLLLHRIRTGNSGKSLEDLGMMLASYECISDIAWLRDRM